MKEADYIKLIKESFKRRLMIHQKKSHDYADTEEMLGNFKRVAAILKILNVDPGTSYGTAIIYITLKLDRFCNLVFSGKKPSNESIRDTVDDLKNYCDLLEGCLIDNQIILVSSSKMVKRQKIHGRRRQGKAFEMMVSNAFSRLVQRCAGLGFWWMRIYDYQTFIHLNPNFFAPKQPADFLACSEGRFYLIECKSSQQNRFPLEIFKPHQEAAMRKITDAGGKYWLLILHRGKVKAEQVIYAFDYECWCKLKTAMKFKTANWELLNAHAKRMFKREKGSWKLGRLFGLED